MNPRNVNDVCSQSSARRRVLAVHDLGLVGMQRQPDLCIRIASAASTSGLPLGHTMHHGVIGVTLELHGRELPLQPRIERVMHEQIGQYG